MEIIVRKEEDLKGVVKNLVVAASKTKIIIQEKKSKLVRVHKINNNLNYYLNSMLLKIVKVSLSERIYFSRLFTFALRNVSVSLLEINVLPKRRIE